MDAALIRIKQNLEAIQARGEHTASNQAESTKKKASIESNQTKMLGILSSLKNDNDIMQKRLETFEKNETPKTHDGAAKNITTSTQYDGAVDKLGDLNSKFHNGAAENSGLQKETFDQNRESSNNVKPLTSSTLISTNLDISKAKAARPTPVLNSPVKEEVPQIEPHSSKMTPICLLYTSDAADE